MARAHWSVGAVVLASILLLTAPAVAAPPGPQLGLPVHVEGGGIVPCFTGCGGVTGVPSGNPFYEQTVVEMVNAVRARQTPPLPPLKRVSPLDDAARYHSADMAVDNYFSHNTQDRVGGTLVFVCSFSDRLSSFYTNWSTVSENIAAGYSSPQAVMTGWMNSDGHRANILRDTSWEIGVGYHQGGAYGHYWTQNFGRRRGVYPVVINREAATTDDHRVALYVYGSGTWPEMRLRNHDAAWSAWVPFRSESAWELPRQRGDHTVWVELRNGGTTTLSSDTIFLDLQNPVLGGLPEAITFTYSIPSQHLMPAAWTLTPSDTNTADTLHWIAAADAAWLQVTPQSGATPQSFTVTPVGFPTTGTGTLSGQLTVTVQSPSGVPGSPHVIRVSLQVVDREIREVYLPLVQRGL